MQNDNTTLQPDYALVRDGKDNGEVPPKTLAYRVDTETGQIILKQKPRTHQFENALKNRVAEELCDDKRFPTKKPVFVSIVHGLHSERGFQDCDLDNRAKTILDALKGVIYDDDTQVHILWTQKMFLKNETESYYRVAIKVLDSKVSDKQVMRSIHNFV